MATDSALSDVGLTLVRALRDGMPFLDRSDVALASPATVGNDNDARVTLYLYRITENADLKNARHERVGESRRRNAPLALDLHYLLTAHPSGGGTDETDRTSSQHAILGAAMQVLHDNAVLRGSRLSGSLADAQEEVRISVVPSEPPSLDTLVSLWGTFPDQPFQPSLSYLVSPVFVDSEVVTDVRRVVETEDQYYGEVGDGGGNPS